MAKRKYLLTMRQKAAIRLYPGLVCLFVGASMWEQAAFEPSRTSARPIHPVTATLLLIVGMALIRGWWRVKRRLERVIEEAVAKSKRKLAGERPE